jgi:hypothetical protein
VHDLHSPTSNATSRSSSAAAHKLAYLVLPKPDGVQK